MAVVVVLVRGGGGGGGVPVGRAAVGESTSPASGGCGNRSCGGRCRGGGVVVLVRRGGGGGGVPVRRAGVGKLTVVESVGDVSLDGVRLNGGHGACDESGEDEHGVA